MECFDHHNTPGSAQAKCHWTSWCYARSFVECVRRKWIPPCFAGFFCLFSMTFVLWLSNIKCISLRQKYKFKCFLRTTLMLRERGRSQCLLIRFIFICQCQCHHMMIISTLSAHYQHISSAHHQLIISSLSIHHKFIIYVVQFIFLNLTPLNLSFAPLYVV